MQFTFSYIGFFVEHLLFAWPLLGFLAIVIMMLGLVVGRFESWGSFDSIYWAFITATTVGYGDIRPKKRFSRLLSILIALIGVTFTGMIVALAINAATLAFSEMHSQAGLEALMRY
ncbi:MAG TPA: potassium channel family protein [Gammaproteobacteria bacterium]|nr:potassium channel family protein [Gammaproteobacteria bacterium]